MQSVRASEKLENDIKAYLNLLAANFCEHGIGNNKKTNKNTMKQKWKYSRFITFPQNFYARWNLSQWWISLNISVKKSHLCTDCWVCHSFISLNDVWGFSRMALSNVSTFELVEDTWLPYWTLSTKLVCLSSHIGAVNAVFSVNFHHLRMNLSNFLSFRRKKFYHNSSTVDNVIPNAILLVTDERFGYME